MNKPLPLAEKAMEVFAAMTDKELNSSNGFPEALAKHAEFVNNIVFIEANEAISIIQMFFKDHTFIQLEYFNTPEPGVEARMGAWQGDIRQGVKIEEAQQKPPTLH